MRPTTQMCLGIRHVGMAQEEDEIYRDTVDRLMKILIQRVITTSVTKRLEFSFARTEDEIRLGWGEGKRGTNASESLQDEWAKMMTELGLEGID